jgi:hypothetical protein
MGDMHAAFAELESIYQEVGERIAQKELRCAMRGLCCDFENADHHLYATLLEIAYFIKCSGKPEGVTPTNCPWFRQGTCHARAGRVLGCRAYFCSNTEASAEIYEEFFQKIKELHARWDIEYRYVPVFKYLSEEHDDLPFT